MSSHKAVAASDEPATATQRATADIALSMLLGEEEGADDAVMPLSDSALRSARMGDDEDEGTDSNVSAKTAYGERRGAEDLDDDRDDGDGDDADANRYSLGGDVPSLKPFREDSRVDRRIIEGMLRDRDTFIEEMETEGFTQAAVLRRAAELGLSEALIRQVKGVAADLAGERPGRRAAPSSLGARTCLSCDRVFLSSGPGNRLCMRCRGGDAGLAQL